MKPFKQFTFQVANMRKEQEFTIYPYDGGDYCYLQSDKRFARLNLRSGIGIINGKNENYANSIKMQMNPVPFTMPENVLTEIKSYLWNNSGLVKGSVVIIENKELYSI